MILHILRLTILTALNVSAGMVLIDVHGYEHTLTVPSVVWILVSGWISFGLAIAFNIGFYKLHPMAVQMKPKKEVHIFGVKYPKKETGDREVSFEK